VLNSIKNTKLILQSVWRG